MTGARGFSLIELIMIVVLISIGMVGLAAMFGRSVGSIGTNVDIQSGAQLVQQCAEQVLGRRRQSGTGYALIDGTVCNGLPSGSYTYSVTLVAIAGSPAGACPDTSSCKEVRITVNGPAGAVARGSVLVSNY